METDRILLQKLGLTPYSEETLRLGQAGDLRLWAGSEPPTPLTSYHLALYDVLRGAPHCSYVADPLSGKAKNFDTVDVLEGLVVWPTNRDIKVCIIMYENTTPTAGVRLNIVRGWEHRLPASQHLRFISADPHTIEYRLAYMTETPELFRPIYTVQQPELCIERVPRHRRA